VDGERWTYRVRSGADARRWYRVDLEFYGGNGRCECKDFATRHEPELARGTASGFNRCKHIRLARALVLDTLIAASGKQPAFGQTLHNVVRRWWENVTAAIQEKEA
jgi:hypothetical protein